MLYQRKRISTGANIGEPGPLPRELQGAMTDADLARVGELVAPERAAEYADQGFFPYTAPVVTVRRISRIELMQRLTMAERIAIRTAVKSDAIAADIYDLLMATETIELDHPDTVNGIGYFVAQGLLTQGRAAAVLA